MGELGCQVHRPPSWGDERTQERTYVSYQKRRGVCGRRPRCKGTGLAVGGEGEDVEKGGALFPGKGSLGMPS